MTLTVAPARLTRLTALGCLGESLFGWREARGRILDGQQNSAVRQLQPGGGAQPGELGTKTPALAPDRPTADAWARPKRGQRRLLPEVDRPLLLTHHPAGVSAIVLGPKAVRHQQHAAEAAREAGVDVIFDPATERLTGPGFDLPQLRSVTCTDNAGQRWLRRILKGQAADSFVDWV